MNWPIAATALRDDENVVAARRLARRISAALSFDPQDQTRVATTVSEISRNAVAYAGGGQIEFALDGDAHPQILRVTVRDQGPGISNLDTIYAGKFKSQTGMGNGIIGAQRLMDEFSIETGRGGTTVAFAKRRPRSEPDLTPDQLAKFVRPIPVDVPNPQDEIKEQNRELLHSLQELKSRGEEIESLASEIESTNRGVVALHGELEASAQELRRASELKTRFLSNMSHEFRTPLNSILALTRLLLARTDGDLTDEQERQVRYIADAAIGLTELVNDLLDIAKVEAGKLEVKPSRFTVSDLFGALRGLLRPLKTSEAVELIFDEPSGVPILFNDESKVTQILRNFISNALKYTPAGTIRVSAMFKEPDRILFAVQDTGIGIPKEFQDLIFQEFEQVPGVFQLKHKGTGLGLPLSRKLAELLRGTVAVDSAPGKGSTFFLDLPAQWTSEAVAPALPAAASSSSRPRVLIVDDEEAFRYVMRRMIDSQQYEILEAVDGDAAVAVAQSARPDIIILDINLPGRDGYAVLDELASDEATRGIPVIISTSLVLTDRDRSRLAHSHAILSKAMLSADLLNVTLSDALQKRGGP